MDVVAIMFGVLVSGALLSFGLSPFFLRRDTRLSRWWRKHIADFDPDSFREENKEEGHNHQQE